MRYCPNIDYRGKEGMQFAPNVPKQDVPKAKARFNALRARESKQDENNDDHQGKSLLFIIMM